MIPNTIEEILSPLGAPQVERVVRHTEVGVGPAMVVSDKRKGFGENMDYLLSG